MSKKTPSDLSKIVAKKGEATSANTYPGDDDTPARSRTRGKSEPGKKIDGRTLRRTGRTFKFAATVKPEWADEIKQLAYDEERLIVEILEDALEAYKKHGRR